MPGQLEHRADVGLAVRPAAALVGFANVLGLTSPQLAELISEKLGENPALERTEGTACRCCGEQIGGTRCWSCNWSHRVHGPAPVHEPADDEPGGAAELLADLRAQLPARDARTAEYLVFNLSSRGLLEIDVPEAAAALDVPPERVWHVLDTLREIGPPGLGARSARECLLLQLDRWERDHGEARPLVRVIVDRFLPDLAAGRVMLVAEATALRADQVRQAHAFIRTHLRPFPAIDLSPRGTTTRVLPDVTITRQLDRYTVELLEPHRFRLRVRELGPDGQAWVRDARLLLSRVEQRWRTLRQVCEFLVTAQHGFLERGEAALVPMTRTAAARAVGVHESTVSRCVSGRHASLPSGRVVPLAAFFPTAPGVHAALRRLIRDNGPCTDLELSAQLGELGFRVARRTVAKYRAQLREGRFGG